MKDCNSQRNSCFTEVPKASVDFNSQDNANTDASSAGDFKDFYSLEPVVPVLFDAITDVHYHSHASSQFFDASAAEEKRVSSCVGNEFISQELADTSMGDHNASDVWG
eukprot:6233159-Karenia_brevis.AAC.1